MRCSFGSTCSVTRGSSALLRARGAGGSVAASASADCAGLTSQVVGSKPTRSR
ncbi:MAG TPA: hypothetical protein VF116_04170 [Ktedonobacterales bacterium]